jgi:hypothetical protein
MQSPGNAPTRTEAELRAALAELGQRAHSADLVLSEMRDAGKGRLRMPKTAVQRRRLGLGRAPLPWLGWPHLVVGAGAAAMAVALAFVLMNGGPAKSHGAPSAIGLLPSVAGSAPPGGPASVPPPGSHPSVASLGRAMLTAFSTAADDLLYDTVTDVTHGRVVDNDQDWSWPALPVPGQLEYVRDASSSLTPDGRLKLSEDGAYTTVVPRPSVYGQLERAHLAVVCYAGTGQTGCGWGPYNTPAGTWATHTGKLIYEDYTPNPRGAELAQGVTRGQWRIIGHTTLDGQRAIKLVQTSSGQTIQGQPVYLWVSTASYLPLRMVAVVASTTETQNWQYQQPTKASLAQLQVPVPKGYPRSG